MSDVNNNTLIGSIPDAEEQVDLYSVLQANVTQRQMAFLLSLIASCGHITKAAEAAGVSRHAHYKWLVDETYQKAYAIAEKLAEKELLNEAIRRAAHGVTEPVFYKGEVVGWIQKYSDKLMDRLLQGAYPKKYGTRHIKSDSVSNVSDDELMEKYPRHKLGDEELALLINRGKQLKEQQEQFS